MKNKLVIVAILCCIGLVFFLFRGKEEDSPVVPGRWVEHVAPRQSLSSAQQKAIKDLEGIGYLAGYTQAPVENGITVYEPEIAYNGYNLYVSGHAPEAILMDMEGNRLHKWVCSFQTAWPDCDDTSKKTQNFWRRVYLYDNGDLLAIFEGYGMIKLDKDSNILWIFDKKPHHDIFVDEQGMIYVLTREGKVDPEYNPKKPILEDFVSVLDPQGKEVKRVSVLKALENSYYSPVLQLDDIHGDFLHTNTVELLDGSHESLNPAFKKGNVLISILHLNLIAVLDMETQTVVWAMSNLWKLQHQPTFLDSGNMLIFDNQGNHGLTRVLEFNPNTQEIVWDYPNDDSVYLFSSSCGSCGRLPNGNTLISETNNGRAIEVTPDRDIVWEFINPHRAGKNDELIASLFEVIRIEPDYCSGWLKN